MAFCLGSNLGPARDNLADAVRTLGDWLIGLRVSSLYQTRSVSPIEQPDYLNAVVTGRSPLAAEQLLAMTKALELAAGRRCGPRHGPRPLDIDLLLYGERTSSRPELTLPHPRLRQRRFFLAPLAEVSPDLQIPPDNVIVTELLAATDATEVLEVTRWSPL